MYVHTDPWYREFFLAQAGSIAKYCLSHETRDSIKTWTAAKGWILPRRQKVRFSSWPLPLLPAVTCLNDMKDQDRCWTSDLHTHLTLTQLCRARSWVSDVTSPRDKGAMRQRRLHPAEAVRKLGQAQRANEEAIKRNDLPAHWLLLLRVFSEDRLGDVRETLLHIIVQPLVGSCCNRGYNRYYCRISI